MVDISVRYAFPDPVLMPTVAAYLELSVSAGDMPVDLLPPDIATIGIPVTGEWFHGMNRHALQLVDPDGIFFGNSSHARWGGGTDGTAFFIAFYPLAWPLLFKTHASLFANKIVPLSPLFGNAGGDLAKAVKAREDFGGRVAIANALLTEQLRSELDAETAMIIRTIGSALGDPACGSVEQMAERAGASQSRVARIAKASFGFAPKLLIRRARFRRMLHRMDAHSYADWRDYIDAQYVDQSHLIRDFRYFMGFSPRAYMNLDRPFMMAAFAAFRAMMGAESKQMWQG